MLGSAPGASVVSDSGVKLAQDNWRDDGALTDAGTALIEQRFRDLEANPHACVPWEGAKLRIMAPFNLKRVVAATQRRKGAKRQGFLALSSFICWVSGSTPSFPPHLPTLCVLASLRLCTVIVGVVRRLRRIFGKEINRAEHAEGEPGKSLSSAYSAYSAVSPNARSLFYK